MGKGARSKEKLKRSEEKKTKEQGGKWERSREQGLRGEVKGAGSKDLSPTLVYKGTLDHPWR